MKGNSQRRLQIQLTPKLPQKVFGFVCTCSIRHLNCTFETWLRHSFCLQMKDLPVMQLQNTERHLQERSLGKIRLTLRLPQQVCRDLFFPQSYSCMEKLSHDVPGMDTHPFHVGAEPLYINIAGILSFLHLQSHHIKGNSQRGLQIQLTPKLPWKVFGFVHEELDTWIVHLKPDYIYFFFRWRIFLSCSYKTQKDICSRRILERSCWH